MQGNHTHVPFRLQSPAFTSDWVVKLRVHVSGPTPLRHHVCSQPGSRLGCGLDDRCARSVRREADDSSVVEINILLSPVARWAGLNGPTRHRRPFLKQGRAGLHGHSTRERSRCYSRRDTSNQRRTSCLSSRQTYVVILSTGQSSPWPWTVTAGPRSDPESQITRLKIGSDC